MTTSYNGIAMSKCIDTEHRNCTTEGARYQLDVHTRFDGKIKGGTREFTIPCTPGSKYTKELGPCTTSSLESSEIAAGRCYL